MESASNGVYGSPAYEIWGDSKWAEFYTYDLYHALGMDREARDVYRRFTGTADDFPRRGAAGTEIPGRPPSLATTLRAPSPRQQGG